MAKKSATVAATAGNDPSNWAANAVEARPIKDLTPYTRNSRTHSEDQIAQVMASIREFGWTIPILCDENGSILAGHCRVTAAERLGIGSVPVMVAWGWTDEQKRAYVIADNKLTLNSSWDEGLLRDELSDLAGLGFDISLTGFTEDELDDIIGGADIVDLEPGSDGSRSGVTTETMNFGDHKIPLTEDELAGLEALLEEHKKTAGSVFGFARRLLRAN